MRLMSSFFRNMAVGTTSWHGNRVRYRNAMRREFGISFKGSGKSSFADPGCLSRIWFFPSRIQGWQDPGSGSESKNLSMVLLSKSSKIRSKVFIPDLVFFHSGSRCQKKHRISDPDPQHWKKAETTTLYVRKESRKQPYFQNAQYCRAVYSTLHQEPTLIIFIANTFYSRISVSWNIIWFKCIRSESTVCTTCQSSSEFYFHENRKF